MTQVDKLRHKGDTGMYEQLSFDFYDDGSQLRNTPRSTIERVLCGEPASTLYDGVVGWPLAELRYMPGQTWYSPEHRTRVVCLIPNGPYYQYRYSGSVFDYAAFSVRHMGPIISVV